MTELLGSAPRSAVVKFHESPSFAAIGDDEAVSSPIAPVLPRGSSHD
jgi:hypothetical protein